MRFATGVTRSSSVAVIVLFIIAACGDDTQVTAPGLLGDGGPSITPTLPDGAGGTGSNKDAGSNPGGGNGGDGGQSNVAGGGTGGTDEDSGVPDSGAPDSGDVLDGALDDDAAIDGNEGGDDNSAAVTTASSAAVALVGQRVKLDGAGTDADGDSLDFEWRQISGPPVGIGFAGYEGDAFFVPQQVGTYVFALSAYDGHVDSPDATVSIDVYDLDGGEAHSLALKPDGTLWSWGYNFNGQLGDGTTAPHTAPARVEANQLDGGPSLPDGGAAPFEAVAIAAGRSHSLALSADGTVWAWGWDAYGQLGNGPGSNADVLNPQPVCEVGASNCYANPLSNVVAISAGYDFSAALRSDGTVVAWGFNQDGQAGVGTLANVDTPVKVCAPGQTDPCALFLQDIVTLAAGGGGHTLAIASTGQVYGWGFNKSGQAGIGNTGHTIDRVLVPTQVCAPGQSEPCASFLSDVVSVDAWSGHSLALTSSGALLGFGGNNDHELGALTSVACYSASSCAPSPVSVCLSGDSPCTSPFNDVVGFSAGRRFSVAIKSDGSAWSWGDNTYYQGGDDSTSNRNYPARVCAPGTTDPCSTYLFGIQAIATGNFHVLALKSDGTLWSWGQNSSGQAGIAGNLDIHVPTQVTGW
jgi:alpha-tubulin suppressor-like RCC1 family protein